MTWITTISTSDGAFPEIRSFRGPPGLPEALFLPGLLRRGPILDDQDGLEDPPSVTDGREGATDSAFAWNQSFSSS